MRVLGRTGFFTTITDVDVDGNAHQVLARDVQFHPVTDLPLHVDFLRVTESTRITVAIPVEFLNEEESPGLRRGGVLNIVRHDVEVSCRADAIPNALVCDLTDLEIGDSIHISHIDLPDGVTPFISDRDFTVATIAAPTVVRDEALEAEAAAEAEAEEGEELEGVEGEGVEGEGEGEGEDAEGGDSQGGEKEKGKGEGG
jgi:large subunit ribosomal protein L25